MKQWSALLPRGLDRLATSPTVGPILPYLASALVMAACLTVLTFFPLGDRTFTVIFVVLLACCWLGGLGPSIFASVFTLVWLRLAGKGMGGFFVFSPKEALDVAVVLFIAIAVGWSSHVKRRAEAELRRHTAQLLQASEEQFKLLVEGTKEYAIYMLDPGGKIMSWNAGAERIKQYTATEIIGQHVSKFYTTADVRSGAAERALGIAVAEGRFESEGLRVRKDGTTFWANVVVTALRDSAGHLRGFSKVTRDITLRKKAEENARRLLEQETARREAERYSQIIEADRERLHVTLTSIGDGVIATDAGGRVTLLNPVAEVLTGWSNQDAEGRPLGEVFAIINEVTRQAAENPVAKVIATGRIVGLANHTVLIAKDGTERPIDDSAAPIRDQRGNTLGVVLVFRDISAKKQAQAQAREAVEHLKIVTDSMSIPVTRCSRDLRYVWVNKPYAEWIGRQPEDIVGRPVREILGEEAFERLLPYFQRVLSGHPAGYDEEVNFRGIGRRWIRAVYSPTVDSMGTVDGWVAVINDVTPDRRLEQALKDADRRKDEFLATLSHELRNPLAPIRNATQILQAKGPPDPDLEWAREIIERQVQHMTRLLDDLLDVSRISYNKMELRKVRVDLATIVDRAVEASRPLIDESDHELTVALPPRKIYLDADPVRLSQVFSNLLNNAAKYTRDKGNIRLTAERQGSDAVVSVKDDGIGIAPDALTRIFEMFSQAESALDRSHGGLGIGLSLVKGLVELHGGSIEARSGGLGTGSEFIVRLPIVIETSVENVVSRVMEGATPSAKKLRLLVVDDLKDSADSLAVVLQLMGHEVQTAYEGAEAVLAAGTFRPEVILLDIGLPKLNGYEAARRIRQEPWGKEVVLVALTGWGQEEDKQRARDCGFDHHLTKPVGADALQNLFAAVSVTRAARS